MFDCQPLPQIIGLPLPYFGLTLGGRPTRLVEAVRRQRRAATSSDELQPSAWGGGGLRGSASRRSPAHSSSGARRHPPMASSLSVQAVEACGAQSNVSCGPPLREASARATLRVAEARPKASPRVYLTAAPLSLRRVYRRPRQFLLDWPSANQQNMPFKRAGDGVLRGIEFFAHRSLFARLWLREDTVLTPDGRTLRVF